MKKAKKSGYGDKKSTLIGNSSRIVVCMVSFVNESKYPLRPRATEAVPGNYSDE